MVRRQLDERQWGKVEGVLATERKAGRPPKDNRNFVEAVLWWRRTGLPWRDLPDDFGPWKTVFNRFDRWSKAGKWSRLFHALQSDRDDECPTPFTVCASGRCREQGVVLPTVSVAFTLPEDGDDGVALKTVARRSDG